MLWCLEGGNQRFAELSLKPKGYHLQDCMYNPEDHNPDFHLHGHIKSNISYFK
jgi:hypothetical protein